MIPETPKKPKIEEKSVSMDFAGRQLTLSTGKLANLASGSVTVQLGDTVLLVTVVMNKHVTDEDRDFFPLTVDYQEKFYAGGVIGGNRYQHREARPTTSAILSSRLTDRPLRPMFPKNIQNDVQIIVTTLSVDKEVDPTPLGIIGASTAINLAGIPFEKPVSAVRIGYMNDEFIVNPTFEETENGLLEIVVAGSEDAVTMVEAGAKELPQDIMLKAIEVGHEQIKKLCGLQKELLSQFEIPELECSYREINPETEKAVREVITNEMIDGLYGKSKLELHDELTKIEESVAEKFQKEIEEDGWKEADINEVIHLRLKERMRERVLKEDTRLDHRKLDEIRTLSSSAGVLPRTHGTGLFQRGLTQILSVTTLGGPGDALTVEELQGSSEKRFFHHYNFPPYSTGEAKPLRGTGRREIGHGNLAERALTPMMPTAEEFPYTVRVVSEVLSCDGSSSMGSVCGTTLSLMDAGVPIKKPVAGIAMGLISDEDKGEYKILSDIQAQEDFLGDMDFKVTGTDEGITALQMDIKVKGLKLDLLKRVMDQASVGRQTIMKSMLDAIPGPRKTVSKYAPLITTVTINPEQIGAVIGKGGETIQEITKECNVEINIEDDGVITITAPDQDSGKKAIEWIKWLTYEPTVGDIFEGKVTRVMDFGAMVEFAPGKEGLVHISKLAHERVNQVTDVVKEGDTIKVKLMEVDQQGRFNLSRKACLPKPNIFRRDK